MASLFTGMLSPGVVIEQCDPRTLDAPEDVLWPAERQAVARAVDKRQREFAAGRVLAEDETSVSVQDDPYRDAARVLQHDAIAERRVSQVSVMPQGLLTTFTREEILELVAYLDGLRGGADAH